MLSNHRTLPQHPFKAFSLTLPERPGNMGRLVNNPDSYHNAIESVRYMCSMDDQSIPAQLRLPCANPPYTNG